MQIVLDLVRADASAAFGAQNARRHRVVETKRRSDGNHELADSSLFRRRELGLRKPARIDLQHGEIGRRVSADQLGRVVLSILQADVDACRFGHDVVVGEDVAVRAQNDAGPTPSNDPAVTLSSEEEGETLILRPVHFDLDADHRRGHRLGNRGQRSLERNGARQRFIVGRALSRRCCRAAECSDGERGAERKDPWAPKRGSNHEHDLPIAPITGGTTV